jgi:hypothetical protein
LNVPLEGLLWSISWSKKYVVFNGRSAAPDLSVTRVTGACRIGGKGGGTTPGILLAPVSHTSVLTQKREVNTTMTALTLSNEER